MAVKILLVRDGVASPRSQRGMATQTFLPGTINERKSLPSDLLLFNEREKFMTSRAAFKISFFAC